MKKRLTERKYNGYFSETSRGYEKYVNIDAADEQCYILNKFDNFTRNRLTISAIYFENYFEIH